MAFFGPVSRFNEFRDEFIKDTGKRAEEDMALYAQYVTARFTDMNHRLLSNLSNDIQELQKILKKV
ncbi:MAG: hypothetical protein JXR41_08130 [Bacteroidales bacterium]|nr:hypothetical protein [Bacteroidales bacterium]MBN2763042.1 hypothetical protein [Bacteroidales bacterium]